MWAGVLYFRAWHQNRSGILQGSTKYDYNEGLNLIWPLMPNFDQSKTQYLKHDQLSEKNGNGA